MNSEDDQVKQEQLLRRAGYKPYHSGGGLMAWINELPNKHHLLITNRDHQLYADPNNLEWTVGRYSETSENFVVYDETVALETAITIGKWLPGPPEHSEIYIYTSPK